MDLIANAAALSDDTLRLANTDDLHARAEEIRNRHAVALHFPKWTDGRAYSQAVLLRARLRYAGRIVATGDVVADMLPLLARCGFDSAQLRADQRPEAAHKVMGHIDQHYQRTLAERTVAAA
jgi:uncharacterized protein (DUF934 family)